MNRNGKSLALLNGKYKGGLEAAGKRSKNVQN